MGGIEILTNNIHFVFIVMLALVAGGLIKDYGIMNTVFRFIQKNIPSKRIALSLITLLSGILPIPGRTIISAPILDSLTQGVGPNARKKLGILDYVATHHYYLWSPLEKSVLIVLAGLGISYFTLLSYIWIPLVAYIGFTIYLIFNYINEDDLNISITKPTSTPFSFKRIIEYMNYKLIAFVTVVIIAGNLIKLYANDISMFMSGYENISVLAIVLLGSLFSFFMGSSSKYAGLVVISVGLVGIQYLPIIFIADFIGYLLSPTHKCLIISKEYFNTGIKEFYKILSILSGILIISALLNYAITV